MTSVCDSVQVRAEQEEQPQRAGRRCHKQWQQVPPAAVKIVFCLLLANMAAACAADAVALSMQLTALQRWSGFVEGHVCRRRVSG